MGEVHFSTDVFKAAAVAGPWLRRDPVVNNDALSLLARQAEQPTGQARFWWLTRGDFFAGLALQIGPRGAVHIRTDDLGGIPDLVEAVAAQAPDPPGVNGQAPAAAAFAGSWATHNPTPVAIAMFQRYYRLDTLVPPPNPPSAGGGPRPATIDDIHATVLPWAVAFQTEALSALTPRHRPVRVSALDPSPGADDDDATVDVEGLRAAMVYKFERREIWLWDDGGPQAMAVASTPVEGVSRVHLVYTPPENRGRGLGTAITGAAVEHVLAAGASHCSLFADLANPTSNAIYQRLGFTPVNEHMNIMFG